MLTNTQRHLVEYATQAVLGDEAKIQVEMVVERAGRRDKKHQNAHKMASQEVRRHNNAHSVGKYSEISQIAVIPADVVARRRSSAEIARLTAVP